MPNEQLIEIERIDRLVVVRFLISEIIGWDEIDQIQLAILEIADGDCQEMLWDMSCVELLSTDFISAYLKVYKRLRGTERRFALCGLSPLVSRLMSPMNPSISLAEFFATREEAIAKMTSPPSSGLQEP